jgi:hypothetical protein
MRPETGKKYQQEAASGKHDVLSTFVVKLLSDRLVAPKCDPHDFSCCDRRGDDVQDSDGGELKRLDGFPVEP